MSLWGGIDPLEGSARERSDEVLKKRIAGLEAKLRNNEEQAAYKISDLETQLNEAMKRLQDKERQIEMSRQELPALRTQLEDAREQREEAEQRAMRFNNSLKNLEQKVRDQARLLDEHEQRSNALVRTERRVHVLEESLALEKSRREEVEKRNEEAHTTITALQGKINDEVRYREMAESKAQGLQEELKRKGAVSDETTQRLQNQVQQLQGALRETDRRMEEAREEASGRIAALSEDALRKSQALRDRCEDLERRVQAYDEAAHTADEAEKQRMESDRRAREYLRQLAVEKAQRHSLESHKMDLEARLAEASRKAEQQEAAGRRLAEQVQELTLERLTWERGQEGDGWRSKSDLAAELALQKRATALLRAEKQGAVRDAEVLRAGSMANFLRDLLQQPPEHRDLGDDGGTPQVTLGHQVAELLQLGAATPLRPARGSSPNRRRERRRGGRSPSQDGADNSVWDAAAPFQPPAACPAPAARGCQPSASSPAAAVPPRAGACARAGGPAVAPTCKTPPTPPIAPPPAAAAPEAHRSVATAQGITSVKAPPSQARGGSAVGSVPFTLYENRRGGAHAPSAARLPSRMPDLGTDTESDASASVGSWAATARHADASKARIQVQELRRRAAEQPAPKVMVLSPRQQSTKSIAAKPVRAARVAGLDGTARRDSGFASDYELDPMLL
eukprot:TRINITY_DN5946_c0_g2_i3.p1 TRINITY_DN5946_c0_g2~~TRINITY_DN5946_c0_g2_i3.p1  ORF type:complete len:700 (+),score=243.77 TRINITY_DN5946_c0_g2_i3:63-2102(+)